MNTQLILDTKDMTDCFFAETKLLGIMTPIRAYQFCWQMNALLGLDFRINNDIEIQLTRKQRNYFFTVYEYAEEHTSLVHYLYKNQFDGEYLLPEFRHLDFLWLLKGDEVADESVEQLAETIRELKEVQMVVELTNEKIKNKEHLIF